MRDRLPCLGSPFTCGLDGVPSSLSFRRSQSTAVLAAAVTHSGLGCGIRCPSTDLWTGGTGCAGGTGQPRRRNAAAHRGSKHLVAQWAFSSIARDLVRADNSAC